jgi:hydroxyacylglutathione hydrolase
MSAAREQSSTPTPRSELDVRVFTVGPIQENAYIVSAAGSGRAVIVDPGAEVERLLQAARALEVEIEAILVTHCHFDHIGAVAEVARATGAPVYCPEIERGVLADINSWTPPGFGPFESYEADQTVAGGERLSLAGLDIEVVFTPGHSPGHVTYAIAAAASEGGAGAAEEDGRGREGGRGERGERALLSGDVLFAGSVGRTDLPGGDWNVLERSIGALLRAFPAETAVYPGHMGTTTLGRELDTNPFLAELRVPVESPAADAGPELMARAVPDAAAGN